jgi:toxin-antitoxin system PIN domain toxin
MKLADTNVWLALVISKHDFHDAAQAWLAKETAPQGVVFCRATQQSFLRLLTTQAVMNQYGNPPLSNAEAWDFVRAALGRYAGRPNR